MNNRYISKTRVFSKINIVKKTSVFFTVLVMIFGLMACNKDQQTSDSSKSFLPPQGFVGQAKTGLTLFNSKCAKCHGMGGRGSKQGPALMHKVYEPSHHSDYSFFMAAKNGVQQHHWTFGNMPAIPDVSPKEMQHIVTYVRQEQRKVGIR